jgi:hypothetical protein
LLQAGGARVTTQTSITARRGTIRWDDLNGEHGYDAMRSYSQSKLACALFGLELSRRSRAGGWDITSTISHPGVAPTSLLASRPEMGRAEDTTEVRMIRWLSARRLLVGTVESATLPALMAATSPAAVDCGFYGPQWPGSAGGPSGEQKLWSPLRSAADATRLWTVSEALTELSLA